MTEWKVYARDSLLRRQGEIDDFADLEAIRRWNDVGTWALTIDRRSPLAGILRQAQAGILITRNDAIWMGGPWAQIRHNVSNGEERMTLHGVDDNFWLMSRLASPSPSESIPPYSAQDYDVRTGVASTILRQYVNANLASGAAAVRRNSLVTLGADPLVGASVTGRARWQVLLALLQELATSAEVGFSLQQVGTGLQFQTFAPTDRTGTARFSRDIENLAEFSYEETAPKANHVFVGGGGEGTARVIAEREGSESVALWGRLEGEFIDRRDTSVGTELNQEGDTKLTEQGLKQALSATLRDTPQVAYGVDYDLGSKVTVELDNPGTTDVIQDLVRRVTLKSDKNGFVVTPAIGTEGTQDNQLRIFRTIYKLAGRITDLERR